eukprot:CAMPEP_0115366532 /NCGR_PEP_ID=MMETSP0270-20121206/104856_1 /TAXON_ID=71861 /ORGANISM="Scrippsiella trochoidea, Strain CCMP3099" /LENGTH=158 /DNA_ID=CAMNT_0002789311 /DNA_START=255 /DNA_END=727 /DNA_ORIENTATION=-
MAFSTVSPASSGVGFIIGLARVGKSISPSSPDSAADSHHEEEQLPVSPPLRKLWLQADAGVLDGVVEGVDRAVGASPHAEGCRIIARMRDDRRLPTRWLHNKLLVSPELLPLQSALHVPANDGLPKSPVCVHANKRLAAGHLGSCLERCWADGSAPMV